MYKVKLSGALCEEKIKIIKLVRTLFDPMPGLKCTKDWVEAAFEGRAFVLDLRTLKVLRHTFFALGEWHGSYDNGPAIVLSWEEAENPYALGAYEVPANEL